MIWDFRLPMYCGGGLLDCILWVGCAVSLLDAAKSVLKLVQRCSAVVERLLWSFESGSGLRIARVWVWLGGSSGFCCVNWQPN